MVVKINKTFKYIGFRLRFLLERARKQIPLHQNNLIDSNVKSSVTTSTHLKRVISSQSCMGR